MKNAQTEQVVSRREEDEMDLSDGENEYKNDLANGELEKHSLPKMVKKDSENYDETSDSLQLIETNDLQDENDTLKCQVESFKNEADFVKAESKHDKEVLEKQMNILQNTLKGMQHQLLTLSQQNVENEAEIAKLNKVLSDKNMKIYKNMGRQSSENSNNSNQNDNEAFLLGIISIYLNTHPKGSSINDIVLYLRKQVNISHYEILNSDSIELILARYPQLFCKIQSKSWTFCGFEKKISW